MKKWLMRVAVLFQAGAGPFLLLPVCCVSGCREKPVDRNIVREYSNHFFATEQPVDKDISRRTLWHTVEGLDEQVAEFVIVSNRVVTFMPTIIQRWGCIQDPREQTEAEIAKGKFAVGGTGEDFHLLTVGIGPNAPTIRQIREQHAEEDMTREAFSNFVERVTGYTTKTHSVLEMETPCPLELLDEAVSGLSRFSGRGITVAPAHRHVVVCRPQSGAVDDPSQDIKVDTRDL
jgi:hypothetical protein